MDLAFSPEERAFRDEVRAFIADAPAGRHPAQGAGRRPAREGRLRALAADPLRARLGRAELAEGARRPRLERGAAAHLPRGDRLRLGAAHAAVRLADGRAGHHGVRQRRAEAALPAEDPQRRGVLVPGLLRARRRLRPRLALHRAVRKGDTTSSTARRRGSPPRSGPTGSSCSRAPTRARRSRRASRSSWPTCDAGHHGAPDRDDRRRRARSTRSTSRTSRCRSRTWSASKAAAGPTPSSCSSTSAPAPPASPAAAACSSNCASCSPRAVDDPRLEDRIAAVEIELEALAFTELRTLAAESAGKRPGPESSILKIKGTEIQQRITELALDALGPTPSGTSRRSTSTSAKPRSTPAPTRSRRTSSPSASSSCTRRRK